MNKEKIFILLLLTIAVIGFTMGAVSASSSTFKIKSNYYCKGKYLPNNDNLMVYYTTENGQYGKGLTVTASDGYNPYIGPFYNKITKVKAFYKNKKTGKIVTKTKKLGYYGVYAHFGVKKGYKLYKVKVWHRKLTKKERKKFKNRFG